MMTRSLESTLAASFSNIGALHEAQGSRHIHA
jgi:hypothetical protein